MALSGGYGYAYGRMGREVNRAYIKQSISLITPPTVVLITLAEAKKFLKVTNSDEDDLITRAIKAATKSAEDFTKRAFLSQTWKLTRDGFGPINENLYFGTRSPIDIPRPPLLSVTSITTYDQNDADSVYDSANYLIDEPGSRVFLKANVTWPTDLRDLAAIEILFVAGYGTLATHVPESITQAVLNHVAKIYENRGVCDKNIYEMPDITKGALRPYQMLSEVGITI